jgi:predicted O-linked N-acetylglucosamine transferase (SPINDLY family)
MPAPPPEKLRRALAAYQSGNLDEAERLSRAVVSAKPGLFDAWHLLGFVQAAMKRGDKAVQSYDRALALRPQSAEALVNRGAALQDMNRFEDALADYDRAIALNGAYPPAHANRGLALHALGRYDAALAAHDRAIAMHPGYGDAHANRASTLYELKRYEEALASYDRALAINAGDIEAQFNRANTLRALKRLDLAFAAYDRVLSRQPDHVGALANRGAALHETRRFGEALAAFDRLASLRPDDADAHYNRANALHSLGSHDEALAAFDRALALRPDFVDALYNRGNTLFVMKRHGAALAGFERVLQIKPDHPYALERAASCVLHLCDWDKRAYYERALARQIRAESAIISPFTLLGYSDDAELQLKCARHFSATIEQGAPMVLRQGPRKSGKLRIAYLSADFQDHAVAYLIAELFELHDRNDLEIFGFSFGRDDGGATRKRLAQAFDRFEDMRGVSDSEAAARVGALDVDIAVDLTGYTSESRPGVLARRPAPLQVNYLGYPGTMGASFIDYVLVDPIVAPPGCETFFSEKIIRLPDCYQANDRQRAIADETPTREQAGLPSDGFVFACFNNNWKITPPVFDIWMRLLRAVEKSVLWLLPSDATAAANLRAAASARGVDPARLIFAERKGLADHLARHRLADLFLDTSPYNAHTTASDALWAGLPLITCPGQAFAARVAASLLTAINAPELIAADAAEYEAMALKLAREPALLAATRDRLTTNRLTTPLFDSRRHTRAIEAAYRTMIGRYERGEGPVGFDVTRGAEATPED